MSLVLNFGENNATCQIFTKFSASTNSNGPRVLFRHVDVDTLLKDTPLAEAHLAGQLSSNKDKTIGVCNYRLAMKRAPRKKFGYGSF